MADHVTSFLLPTHPQGYTSIERLNLYCGLYYWYKQKDNSGFNGGRGPIRKNRKKEVSVGAICSS